MLFESKGLKGKQEELKEMSFIEFLEENGKVDVYEYLDEVEELQEVLESLNYITKLEGEYLIFVNKEEKKEHRVGETTRTLIKNKGGSGGYSYRVSLPIDFVRDLEMEDDEEVRLVLDYKNQSINIEKKEMEEMKKLDKLILNEDGEKETFYIAINFRGGLHISNKFYDISNPEEKREVRRIEVYHDGLYFGTTEEMEDYIIEKIIDHLKGEKHIVKDGETIMEESIWKWSK